jgi:hypothetical protein
MLADADGANARRLRGGHYSAVAFSPNGRRMAFVYLDRNSNPHWQIEIARNDGTTIKSIRVHARRYILALTWTRAPKR